MSSMPQEGEIDILIATDCISEGQNLQDCDYLINYDIHWNPVSLLRDKFCVLNTEFGVQEKAREGITTSSLNFRAVTIVRLPNSVR